MPYLLETRFQEIAARVTELAPDRLARFQFESPSSFGPIRYTLRRLGLLEVSNGAGPESAEEVYALDRLVSLGEITEAEAEAFLTEKYPEQQWSGAQWGSQSVRQAQEEASERALALPSDPDQETESALASLVQLTPGGTAASGIGALAPSGAQPILLDQLPVAYRSEEVQEVIQSGVDQVALGLQALTEGKLQLRAGSVDGSVIRPGSLPLTSLPPRALSRASGAAPTAEQAVIVDLAPSRSMDRFSVDADSRGPGRVWKAQGLSFPPGPRVDAGPARYRLITNGMRFGVMAVRMPPGTDLSSSTTPGFEIRYGVIVQGIRHFLGRRPERILAALSAGMPPVSARSEHDDGGGAGSLWPGTEELYWDWADDRYRLATAAFATAFGSDALLYPSASSLIAARGLSFSLITGSTAEEVFLQLNTLPGLGQTLGRHGCGPSAAVPPTELVEAPAPPNVIQWDGDTGAGAEYRHLNESNDLASEGRIVQGVPFSLKDCGRLVSTDTHFSIVVQFVAPKLSGGLSASQSWASPAHWHENGLELDSRNWAVDVIIH